MDYDRKEAKHALREQLARDTERFLKRGGRIVEVPMDEYQGNSRRPARDTSEST